MKLDVKNLDFIQKNIFSLVPIYTRYGYTQYRMSKFEEYDLYSKNKDFLVSDSVITFTDTNGKLMALKPDVTLSIVKNSDREVKGVEKLYYNENVYRVSKGTNCFKEITQMGLECIGEVGSYEIGEVLYLAAQSLKALSDSFVLEVSHLGIMAAAVEAVSSDYKLQSKIWKYINDKNYHSIEELCLQAQANTEALPVLKKLMSISGTPKSVLPELEQIAKDAGVTDGLCELKSALSVFEGSELESNIIIDFSAVGDINYYNGIIFNGFLDTVPESVLSGGQYDALMKKMKKKSRAVGFAVYLDLLERLGESEAGFDVDLMLVYSPDCSPAEVLKAVRGFEEKGKSVFACSADNGKIKANEVYSLKKGGVIELETDA